ncbi:MAG: MarR family transcriptional regulator [Pseudomonadota bacterium]|nr:MarR family transcriptional regulator [Pseudomonadota bacterium]
MVKMREEEGQVPSHLEDGDYALADSLAVRIDWLNNELERQTRALLEMPFGLTPVEWRCLATLCVRGAMTGADLSELTAESPAQISRALRRLRDDGLVAWPAGTQKRGFGASFATEEGRALFAQVKPVMLSRNLWLLDGLEPEERTEIYRLVAKLRARMEELPDADALTRRLNQSAHEATNT